MSNPEDRIEAPESNSRRLHLTPVGVLLGFLIIALIVIVGLALLLLSSVLVVHVTGVTARWLSLSELHVMLAYLALSVALVIGFASRHIGSEVTTATKRIESAIESASEQVADAVNGSVAELESTLEKRRDVAVIDLVGAFPAGRKSSRRNR